MKPRIPMEGALAPRRWLALSRATVASACFAVQLVPSAHGHWAVTILAGAMAAYGLLGFLLPRLMGPFQDLLALVADTTLLLTFAAFGADGGAFLSSAVYFHVLLSTMFLRPWWDTWLVVAVSAGFLAVVRTERTAELLPVVVWSGLLAAVGALHGSRRERVFEEYARQASEYREQAERARDSERKQLAGDFHDGPLQVFTGLQLRLEVLRKILEKNPQAAGQELRVLQELAKSQTSEMRAFLRGIRREEMGRAGLIASLRREVDDFQKHTGVTATFQSLGSPASESPEIATELVQIVREALTNVQKHAQASRVAVAVRADRSQIAITIEDNGVGYSFGGAFNQEELETLRMGPA
ncbi:MAG TPA: sensor histidine kinase, partial [Bryobacteraceae bacterium]|nr:sensor histidine kinase [Bryobacteraceae bacterium]